MQTPPNRCISGITPADAGKTGCALTQEDEKEDHPRGCGENLTTSPQNSASAGSPPRMRGKPFGGNYKKIRARITPADAGKTRLYGVCKIFYWDHPRGCGENRRHERGGVRNGGSPPRMRGKLPSFYTMLVSYRITPADAGKTRVW